MALIELEDVHFQYTGRKAEALQGTSLRIQEGETVLLLGASGSGKSTLALCLRGLIPQSISGTFRGKASISGYDVASTSVAELAQHVGVVFQDPEAQCIMTTVEDEVSFGLENLCLSPAVMGERISAALDQVSMSERRYARIESLSGGGKQRLAVASLLAMRPRILLFDEPTANLDPVGTRDIFSAIQQLKQGATYTIVLIEHKLDALIHLIDKVIVLSPNGKVLVEGEPRTVFRDHTPTLLAYGIWVPQIALLAHHLRERGQRLEPFPLTHDEAVQAWKQVSIACVTPFPPLPTSDGVVTAASEQVEEFASAPAKPAVEISHLSFQSGKQRILDDISLCVPRGDVLAIVGANGAGKTTLLQHLANILHPPRGCIRLHGQDITRLSAGELTRQVGYVFQNPEHQFVTDTVEQELRFGLHMQKRPEAEIMQRVSHSLERFGLSRYAKANPFTLSHGEKRRLSVATMLVMDQRVLLLDEPTFGQDQRNAVALLELLETLRAEGRTIILITHDMSLVAEYAHHVAVLTRGRLTYHGSVEGLFLQSDLIEQASLSLPPLAELSQHLTAADHPEWGSLFTLDQFLRKFPVRLKAHMS